MIGKSSRRAICPCSPTYFSVKSLPPRSVQKLVRRRYAEPMIDAVALVPMKTLPGWPEAEFSSVHLLMLCVVWPIATAVLFTLIGWGVHFAKGRGGKNSD